MNKGATDVVLQMLQHILTMKVANESIPFAPILLFLLRLKQTKKKNTTATNNNPTRNDLEKFRKTFRERTVY
jgi:hypothetical protein